MAHVYCDREDCCYRSLGGWCQLGHPRFEAQAVASEADCRLIRAFRQSQADTNPNR